MMLTAPPEARINKAFQKMTHEERMDLAYKSICGAHIYGENGSVTILMGSYAMNQMNLFKWRMIKKYKP